MSDSNFKDIKCSNDLMNYFITLAPDFEKYWNAPDNLSYEDNGEQRISGICTEFAHYYIEQERYVDAVTKAKNIKWDIAMTTSLDDRTTEELFNFIEHALENQKKADDELSGCLCVCFLENISQTKAAEESKKWMGKLSREFFDHWHVYRPSHPLG